MKAVDVMTRNVVSVELDSSVFEAAQRMILNRISRLPVLDASSKLVCIVTESDLLRRAETGTMRRRPSWLEFFLGNGRLAAEYVRTHASKIRDVMTSDSSIAWRLGPLIARQTKAPLLFGPGPGQSASKRSARVY
jgi:CBS-domain-containing membrane protein